MTGSEIFESTRLPKGGISNRIAKAAVEENLSDDDHAPGSALVTLYWRWAEGGADPISTGSVMVDNQA